jgi:hypothetical protein
LLLVVAALCMHLDQAGLELALTHWRCWCHFRWPERSQGKWQSLLLEQVEPYLKYQLAQELLRAQMAEPH